MTTFCSTLSIHQSRFLKISLFVALHMGGSLLAARADAGEQGFELRSLKSLIPYVARWKAAIRKKDLAGAKAAGEKYEAKWQGIEVYVNHRSVPLYRDMEIDTQSVIDAELEKASPDFNLMKQKIAHLGQDVRATLQMAKAGPKLSPLFDDLVSLRDLRTRTLLIIRSSLSTTTPNVAKAKAALQTFKTDFSGVESLIAFRSPEVVRLVKTSLAAADGVFANPSSSIEQMTAANTDLIGAYGLGVNLVNAAARTSNLSKTALTSTDKNALTQLNKIHLALTNASPQAGETGPSSDFAALQPTLEGLGRSINAVGTLRTALLAYDLAVKATTVDTAAVEKARKAAVLAVAITQQALAGQFWGTAELQSFLATLPTS